MVKCYEDNLVVKEQVGIFGNGRVLVVDGGGLLWCVLFGDMLVEKVVVNGWVGLIIYGCICDVDEIGKIDLGVQVLCIIFIKSNWQGRGDFDILVSFGGVIFLFGEFVYVDNNGVIVFQKVFEMF